MKLPIFRNYQRVSGLLNNKVNTYVQDLINLNPIFYLPLRDTTTTPVEKYGSFTTTPFYSGNYTLNSESISPSGDLNTLFTDGYVDTNLSTAYTSAFGVSLWCKAVGEGGFLPHVFSKNQYYASSALKFPFRITREPTNIKAVFSKGDDYTEDVILQYDIDHTVLVNIIVNYTATVGMSMYINGIERASSAWAYTISTSSTTAKYRIGKATEYGGGIGLSHFNGVISDVIFRNSIFTADEIAILANI